MDDLKKRLEQLQGNKVAPIAEAAESEEVESETIDTIFGPVVRKPLMTSEPRMQEENTPETEPFRIGQLSCDYWGPFTTAYSQVGKFDVTPYRMALPKPKWPLPGELATGEIAHQYDREREIYTNANRALRDLLVFLRLNPDEENPQWSQESVLRAAEGRKFLEGLWTAKGYPIPSRDELLAMARQTTPASADEVPAKSAHYLEHFENKPQWIPGWQMQRGG
jgi:hypothetical protein